MTQKSRQTKALTRNLCSIAALCLVQVGCQALGTTAAKADPFQLGAETKEFIDNGGSTGNYSYPSPQMMQPSPDVRPTQRLNASASQTQQRPPRQAPIQAAVQKSVALPPSYLGAWRVQGQRTGIEALPQYQNGVGNLFAPTTSNVWNIAGNPQKGYTLTTDQGVSTSLNIYKVTGNQAFIRYQHPISKTMAQEAIVMQLQNGAMAFEGLERISIVKEGEPQPRAKVTYQLFGRRQ